MQLTILQIEVDELRAIIRVCISEAFAKQAELRPSSKLIKIDEVCSLLRVSRVTINKWKKEGKLPYHRISNRIFFKESEILTALTLKRSLR